jgi:hypothetical protein
MQPKLHTRIVKPAMLLLALLLPGCESKPEETGRGGVAEVDAKALDVAAEKLDQQRITLPPVPETTLQSPQKETDKKSR